MRTTLGHLRQHFQDSLLVQPGQAHVLKPIAKSLIAPLNEMLGQANQFAALRPSNIQPEINLKIRIVASDCTILACLDTTLRTVRGGFHNLRLDILPLSERAPQLLAKGAVDLVLAGQSLDVGVPPPMIACTKINSFIFHTRKRARLGMFCRSNISQSETIWSSGILSIKSPLKMRVPFAKLGHPTTPDCNLVTYSRGRIDIPNTHAGDNSRAACAGFCQALIDKILPFPFAQAPIQVFAYWQPSRDQDTVLQAFVMPKSGIKSSYTRVKDSFTNVLQP